MLRYAITDRSLFGGNLQRMLTHYVQLAPQLHYLQLRERDLPAHTLHAFTLDLMAALQPLPRRPKLLINHRADVALACAADGVHLRSGSGELAPQQVRTLYRQAHLPQPVLSVSCHSLSQVASAADADLLLFGPVYQKPLPAPAPALPGTGLQLLAQACQASRVPVLALGGITAQNQQTCLAAGAAGVAGIRLFASAASLVSSVIC